MIVPYEFDEARRAIQTFQGATDLFEEDAECENFVKSVTQAMEIDIEGDLSDDIWMGWYMRYGQTMADMMKKIALKRAAESTMSTLEAMQQIDKGVAVIYQERQRIVELAGQMLHECAAAISEIWSRVMAEIEKAWPIAIAAWEEIQKLMKQSADVAEPEEEDQHDGAVKVLVTWLLPVPTLYELYGQGVDHGGPGPSRLTLTSVTDDGLRRAETGQIRKGDSRMKKCKGFDMVEAADLDAAITWAKNIRAEDPEKEPEIKTLRDVLVTGLAYARVVADNMGGLPCFHEGQTPEERQKAMAAAASMARRPDGSTKKNKGKKGAK